MNMPALNLRAPAPSIAMPELQGDVRPSVRPSTAQRILVPVDGSLASQCAVAHAIDIASRARGVELVALNVQAPVLSGEISPAISAKMVAAWRAAAGEEMLRNAKVLLEANRVDYALHVVLGEPADAIVGFARQHGCAAIVMGTRGQSAIANLVLGSVAARVVRLAEVPVTLVKHAGRKAAAARRPRDLFDSCSANDGGAPAWHA